jgi:hypothetical protein
MICCSERKQSLALNRRYVDASTITVREAAFCMDAERRAHRKLYELRRPGILVHEVHQVHSDRGIREWKAYQILLAEDLILPDR